MKYKVISLAGHSAFDVVETYTQQVIKHFKWNELPVAKKLAKKLNSGAGFDGNTPPFFLKECVIKLKQKKK